MFTVSREVIPCLFVQLVNDRFCFCGRSVYPLQNKTLSLLNYFMRVEGILRDLCSYSPQGQKVEGNQAKYFYTNLSRPSG